MASPSSCHPLLLTLRQKLQRSQALLATAQPRFCSYFRHRRCTAAKFHRHICVILFFFFHNFLQVGLFLHTKPDIFTLPRSTKRHLVLASRLSARPSRSISDERCQLPGRVEQVGRKVGGGPDLFTKSLSKTLSVEQPQRLQAKRVRTWVLPCGKAVPRRLLAGYTLGRLKAMLFFFHFYVCC